MGRTCKSFLMIPFLWIGISNLALGQSKLDRARERYVQAEAYFKAGAFDKAILEYKEAYALAPKPALLFNMGLCLENSKKPNLAIKEYKNYLDKDPHGGKAAEARARIASLERRLLEEKLVFDKQSKVANLKKIGLQDLKQNKNSEALAKFINAYRLSGDPEIVYYLAEAYRQKGDTTLAKTEYKRYLEASPTGVHRSQASMRLQHLEVSQQKPNQTNVRATQRQRGSWVPSIVAFSIAGVSAGVGIAYGRRASNLKTELQEGFKFGTPPIDSRDPKFDSGNASARNANIAFAVAGAATLTGVVLTVLAFRGKKKAPAYALTPIINRNDFGITCVRNF